MSAEKTKVLFICVKNSARSQIAEEYLRRMAGDIFEVESAGLNPGDLNPIVIEILKRDGIDISNKKTQSVRALWEAGKTYSYVITVCSRDIEDNCPIFPGPVRRLNWPFPDPEQLEGSDEERLKKTMEIRDVIVEELRQFIAGFRAKKD